MPCEVFALSDAKALRELLKTELFDVIIVSTLGGNYDPLLVAEQSKSLQPAARLLLWGAIAAAIPPRLHDYVDGQLLMPCTLAQLKSAILQTSA